jgi:two-component system, NtrC family, nitrogen regulation sensor histidine kinase NtrY
MRRVTLGQRLLLATAVLALAVAAAVGFGVREAWRTTESTGFRSEFHLAVNQLESELRTNITDLPTLIAPLCEHDPLIDSALISLRTDRLDSAQRLSLSSRTLSLMKALRVDELYLVTGDGEILGSGHAGARLGSTDLALGTRVKERDAPSRVRAGEPWAFEAVCVREEAGKAVGLYAARYLSPLLAQVAASHGVALHVGEVPDEAGQGQMREEIDLPELGGLPLVATRSRVPLSQALRQLDFTIFAIGAATVLAALAVAWLLSRGLSRPIARLSEQARAVVGGEPKPVEATGGKELEELADAFNQAISDLVGMRKRLVATERIAAWREIARRVAHEIKNPLAPIRAAMETLRRLRYRKDPAFDEYFDEATTTVLDEVRRISNIVSEFTRFARLPAPEPAATDLGQLIRQVVGLHQGHGAPIQLEIKPCPPVQVDRDQITQVLTNLIQNALEALGTAPGGKVYVELTVRDPGGAVPAAWAEIAVEDNGPGLEPSVRANLFEPYFTTKPEGTGLGLAIVQRIVTEHGGEIRLEQARQGGARFVICLPITGPGAKDD